MPCRLKTLKWFFFFFGDIYTGALQTNTGTCAPVKSVWWRHCYKEWFWVFQICFLIILAPLAACHLVLITPKLSYSHHNNLDEYIALHVGGKKCISFGHKCQYFSSWERDSKMSCLESGLLILCCSWAVDLQHGCYGVCYTSKAL